MSRLVCFIDEEGQTATCISEDQNCENCQYNDDAHKKWIAELNAKPKTTMAEFGRTHKVGEDDENYSHLLNGIKTRELGISINFIDQDIIIHGVASTDGIEVFCVTRCFEEDLGCENPNCMKCPYVDKSKQEAIYNKYEMTVVEIMRDVYRKIEALL